MTAKLVENSLSLCQNSSGPVLRVLSSVVINDPGVRDRSSRYTFCKMSIGQSLYIYIYIYISGLFKCYIKEV